MRLALPLLLIACGEKDPRERDNLDRREGNSPEDTASFSCDDPEIVVDGQDPPAVGDTWTLWLWCGDVLMQGNMILRTDPLDFAFIDSNTAEFRYAGEGSISLQTGSHKAEREVTVLPQ